MTGEETDEGPVEGPDEGSDEWLDEEPDKGPAEGEELERIATFLLSLNELAAVHTYSLSFSLPHTRAHTIGLGVQ